MFAVTCPRTPNDNDALRPIGSAEGGHASVPGVFGDCKVLPAELAEASEGPSERGACERIESPHQTPELDAAFRSHPLNMSSRAGEEVKPLGAE